MANRDSWHANCHLHLVEGGSLHAEKSLFAIFDYLFKTCYMISKAEGGVRATDSPQALLLKHARIGYLLPTPPIHEISPELDKPEAS